MDAGNEQHRTATAAKRKEDRLNGYRPGCVSIIDSEVILMKKNRSRNKSNGLHMAAWAAVLFILSMIACAPLADKDVPVLASPQDHGRLARAQGLRAKGHYTALLEAHQIFQDLLSVPSLADTAEKGFIRTGILIHLRKKELGIVTDSTLEKIDDFLVGRSQLHEYLELIDLVRRIPPSVKGVLGETRADKSDMEDYLDWLRNRFPALNEKLRLKAASDEFYAYLYLSFVEAFSFKFQTLPDFSAIRNSFPDSSLLKFKQAIFPKILTKDLMDILSCDPDFAEAHFFLGDQSLGEGLVLSSEKHFREAMAAFPESTSTLISLARIHLYLEEIDKSLSYNEKALALAPHYRDALLGKGMCLCYLGRFEESLEVLNKMLLLGKYMLGEAYYWTARNQNELDRLEEAGKNINEARKYIIGQYEIPALEGQIEYKQKHLNEAEEHLKEALSLYNADCESSYTLGQIYSDRSQWYESAVHFAQGSVCNGLRENALEGKIQEIEKSDLIPARKENLILIKKTQLLQHRRTRAGCDYNAAASFYNAGKVESALEMAKKAAAYPLFKNQALELIRRIEKEKSH